MLENGLLVLLFQNMKWEQEILKEFEKKEKFFIRQLQITNHKKILQEALFNQPDLFLCPMEQKDAWRKEIEEVQKKVPTMKIILIENDLKISEDESMETVSTKDMQLRWALNHHLFACLKQNTPYITWEHFLKEVTVLVTKRKYEQKIMEEYRKTKELTHLKNSQKIFEQMLQSPLEVKALLLEINRRYHLKLKEEGFYIVVFQTNCMDLILNRSDFMLDVFHIWKENISRSFEFLQMSKEPYGYVFLINTKNEWKRDYIKSRMEHIYQGLNQLQRKYDEFQIALGVSSYGKNLEEMNRLLKSAYQAIAYKFIRHDRIYYDWEILPKESSTLNVMEDETKKNLIRICQKLDGNEFCEWIEKVYQDYKERLVENPIGFIYLKNEILKTVRQVWKDEQTQVFLEKEEVQFYSLDFCFSHECMFQKLNELLISIFQKKVISGHANLVEPIEESMLFIKENLALPLTLDEIASRVHLTPSYFSTLFKEQTGMTYIDYLSEVRLSYAKELLQENVYLVKEVAKKVGYLDEKYFRKLFKKRFGILPSQLKVHKKEQE